MVLSQQTGDLPDFEVGRHRSYGMRLVAIRYSWQEVLQCHDPPERRGASWLERSAIREMYSMGADDQISYLEYAIKITREGQRFTASVSRDGSLITHDGRASEVWVSASCNSRDRAIWVAKNAIDTDRIR